VSGANGPFRANRSRLYTRDVRALETKPLRSSRLEISSRQAGTSFVRSLHLEMFASPKRDSHSGPLRISRNSFPRESAAAPIPSSSRCSVVSWELRVHPIQASLSIETRDSQALHHATIRDEARRESGLQRKYGSGIKEARARTRRSNRCLDLTSYSDAGCDSARAGFKIKRVRFQEPSANASAFNSHEIARRRETPLTHRGRKCTRRCNDQRSLIRPRGREREIFSERINFSLKVRRSISAIHEE